MEKTDLLNQLRLNSNEREEASTSKRWIWITLIVVVILAGLAAGAWLYFGQQRFEVQTATSAAPSAGGGNTAVLQATGYVTARRQATVSAQITGTLIQVLIEEGDRVADGQVLAKLEDTAQRAGLAQAEAQLHSAQSLLVQYQTQLAQNRRDLKRNEDLVDRKLVSTQAVELTRTQVDSQIAQVTTQRRQIELAQASVRAAQVQLDYCTVHAPFAGVVIAKAAQVGEIVSPLSAGGGFTRTGVGTIVDMDSLEIEVDVNEAYINRVVPNQPAQTVLDAYPEWKIPSHVIAVIPTADKGKATVKVRVAIEAKDSRVLPDMGARVSFLEDKKAQANAPAPKGVLVPASSITQRDGHTVIFAVEADRAHAKPVTAQQTYGDLRLVDGIGTGVQVVKQPPAEMNDNAKVTIVGDKK
ncbi:MAG: efflux RND transporter periplasmic adaptor subunit [Rudaea sp.]